MSRRLYTASKCWLEPKGDDGIVVTAVTVHNQGGQLVLSGQHKYLLRRQRAVRNGDG
jgi:acyl dehydratase